MLYKNKHYLILLLFTVAITNVVMAQPVKTNREKIVLPQINAQLQIMFGENSYKANSATDVDSMLGNYKYYEPPIEDPYSTLKGCFIFTTTVAGTGENSISDPYQKISLEMIGVYKDGLILWHSEPQIGDNFGSLFTTLDLNADGNVEIITQWLRGSKGSSLWIFSWDGNEGWRINDVEKQNWPYFSIISGEQGGWGIFDEEGDGIWEIYNQYSQYGFDSWSYNNNKYGKWTSTPEFDNKKFLPRNNLNVNVYCKVERFNDSLIYNYSIVNELSSKQRVSTIYIQAKTSNVKTKTPNKYWAQKKNYLFSLDGWTIDAYRNYGFLERGHSLSGFKKISNTALPIIGKFYIRGDNALPDIVNMSDGEYTLLDSADIVNNSLVGYTLGLKDPPDPFSPSDLLDSLLSYDYSAFQLGWIKDSTIAEKYSSYFNSAKIQLQQNNIAGASATLNQILLDVNQDSTSNLTSEAYALIRYNTEYLIDHLPASNTFKLIVQLTNSRDSLLTGGSLQYYEGGWKDAVNNGDGTFGINTERTNLSLRMHYEHGSSTVSNIPAQNNTYIFHTTNVSVQLQNSTGELIDSGSVQYYAGGWRTFGSTANGITNKELLPGSYSFRMHYAYGRNDKKQDIGADSVVIFKTVNANVELRNSLDENIDQGTVQYYSGGWRTFGTTTNGITKKELLPGSYSFRMRYAYGRNDKKQDVGTDSVVIFRTVNTNVELRNSLNEFIDEGTVQYYAGGWRTFGTTTNGISDKELLPGSYSFRMRYAYGRNDKKQDIGADSVVIFKTVNANVELRNSLNQLIDQGTVQYYAGGWRTFGTTMNGVSKKELLPGNYSFRMRYAYGRNDKKQNIGADSVVIFNTVNTNVELRNSLNQLIDQGTVQYYAGGWRIFGTTTNGISSKELLPGSYSFRMRYAYGRNDKKQNISIDSVVIFKTVNAKVELKNSLGQPIDTGTVSYYSGGWRNMGTTTNGIAGKELLPGNYSFRMLHDYISADKKQNIGTDDTVIFTTVICTVNVINSRGGPVNGADILYYSGGWRNIGSTQNGRVTKEMLGKNITFRMRYNNIQKDKQQDISIDNTVNFKTDIQ